MGHDKTLDHFLHDYEASLKKLLKWIFVVNDVWAFKHFATLNVQNLFPSIIFATFAKVMNIVTGRNDEDYTCRPQ